MDGQVTSQTIMLQLGDFQFSTLTLAYQTLTQRSAWKWAEQERFGQSPALQFTGKESQTISLPGVVYQQFTGSWVDLDTLRQMADTGEPYDLVSGQGLVLGQWVIVSIEETKSAFAGWGVERKSDFTISLKEYIE